MAMTRPALAALAMSLLAPGALAAEGLPPGHPPLTGGIGLPFDVRLHGRFDLAYERYGYTDDPSEGYDALRNYHRFVFLERHVKDDPFYFNAEILGLTFYEIGARIHGAKDDIWRLSFTGGKVMVPFGADPLFHHAYGGRVGADQRVLPFVWAELGVKGALDLDLAPWRLKVDAFLVRGLALGKADDILNIQGDAAPLDDLNFAGGGRIAAGFGPLTFSWSAYASHLDFGRSLFMQAFDAGVWRPDLGPVLERFAVTLGVLRADVWGGGGEPYYHFADYLQIRFYALDCLYVQYRGGLDMRDNRSGVFADASRLDRFDTSAHSVAVGWVYGPFTLVLSHLWQLELRDEQPDDHLRLTASYEF